MSDKQKKGIFYDAAQTVEDMRKLISWFRIEDCRTDMVRFGNEFAHPLGADALSMDTSADIAARTNITAPETFPQLREEVQNGSKRAFDQANLDHPEWEEFGWWEEYDDIPGCPEEPDAPKLHALVRRLRENEAKGPFPTILVIPTGALFFNDIWLFSNATITKYLGAQTVIPKFRSLVDAPYPAAVNDLHATYQWMIDNAQALNIDTDRIVIYGMSSGGHLASALPFRLKRYGWCGGHMRRCPSWTTGRLPARCAPSERAGPVCLIAQPTCATWEITLHQDLSALRLTQTMQPLRSAEAFAPTFSRLTH